MLMALNEESVMNKLLNISLLFISFAAMLALTGCNTVQGAFQGAGQDARAVSHQLQLDDSHPRSTTYYKKKQVTTTSVQPEPVTEPVTESVTTTSTTTTSPTTPPLSPSGD